MANEDDLVVDAAERVFADLADPQTILKSGAKDWKTPLWRALDEMGLPQAWLPEELGGHGLSLREGFGVVRAAGRAALALPLIETMIAGRIAGQAGLRLPAGAATVIIDADRADVQADERGVLRVRARQVPFAGEVQSVVVVAARPAGCLVAVVPSSACQVTPGVSLAGDPAGNVSIETRIDQRAAEAIQAAAATQAPQAAQAVQAACTDLSPDHALFLAATCRSLQIAGALQAILGMSVQYSKERVAFEKPIAKFQAVQQNLARLAGETAAAVAASESAADTLASNGTPAAQCLLEVASAKVRCGEAAETGSAIAHQVLGAIGFTEEHVLHRFTLRALSWRDDFGTEMVWARRLGEAVGRQRGADLWRLLSAR